MRVELALLCRAASSYRCPHAISCRSGAEVTSDASVHGRRTVDLSLPGVAARLPGGVIPKDGFDQLCALATGLRKLQQPRTPKRPRRGAPTITLCNEYEIQRGGDDGGVFIQRLLSSTRGVAVLPGCEVPARGGAAARQVSPPSCCCPSCFDSLAATAGLRGVQLKDARPAVRLRAGARVIRAAGQDVAPLSPRAPLAANRDGAVVDATTTAQAVLCLQCPRGSASSSEQDTPWYLFCLPHRELDQSQGGWSSRAGAIVAQRVSGVVGAVPLPPTPEAPVLQALLAHAEHLSGYALREVSPWADAVLVPMDDVLGPVTVVPVLPEHPHAGDVQRARRDALVFVLDNLH